MYNQIKKINAIAEIVEANYEPGRQDKSLRRIYRDYIKPVYFINERTFRRYLKIAREKLGFKFDTYKNPA